MATRESLAIADYVVIALVLAVPLGVGIYLAIVGRKRNSKEDYLLGSRQLHVLPVTLSLFVTYMSSTSLIGMPAESYTTGSDIVLHAIGIALSFFVGIFTVIPIMHPLKVTSLYEYFELRFGSYWLRLFVTVVAMCQKIIFTAVVFLSPALSVQTASNLPFWVSVVIVGTVGIIYTAIGGIRGVVLVDVFQAAIIMIGIFAVLIKGIIEIGGLETTWSIAKEGDRIQPVDWDPDPRVRHSIWALAGGGMFSFFAYSFDQAAIQRISSIPTMTGARIAYAVNIVVVSIYITLVCFMGTVAYSYFATVGCDPFKSGTLSNRNQLVPYFVMQLFHDLPGMAGLYLATVFSGSLSTVSSIINGLAANTIEDLLRYPFQKYKSSESTKLLTAKLSVCFYGAICMGLAFVAREFPGSVIQTGIALLGALGGPVVGLFFLGASLPWPNKIGATVGLIASLVVNIWLSTGAVLYGQKPGMLPPAPGNSCSLLEPDNTTVSSLYVNVTSTTSLPEVASEAPARTVYDISYQNYGLTGWLVTFIVGLIVSLLTCKWSQPILDERYFFPCFRKVWKLNNSYTITETEDKDAMKLDTKTRSVDT